MLFKVPLLCWHGFALYLMAKLFAVSSYAAATASFSAYLIPPEVLHEVLLSYLDCVLCFPLRISFPERRIHVPLSLRIGVNPLSQERIDTFKASDACYIW